MKKRTTPVRPAGSPDTAVIGLIQSRAAPDPRENLDRTLSKIAEAAGSGAGIVCLQELFLTHYFPQTEDAAHFRWAEEIPGPTTRELARAARRHRITLIGSIFEKRTQGLYHNTAVIFNEEGEIAGLYRKMHIPDDPCFYEKFYFAPGDLGFVSLPTPSARVGALVCWDQWFPEAARVTALKGAQILFYPTAIGWHKKEPSAAASAQLQAWETVQRSHAIANGVFVAAVNRVGQEGDLQFWGASFVADPAGEIIAKAGHDDEEILIVPCDLSRIDQIRNGWPFLRDRRIDAYEGLLKRFDDGVTT